MKRRELLQRSGQSAWVVPVALSTTLPAHAQTSTSGAAYSKVFDRAGSYTFTVPNGVTRIDVEISGAGGGGGTAYHTQKRRFPAANGGAGDALQTRIAVSPGQVLTITVGAGGLGGVAQSGVYPGGQGGGASQIEGLAIASGGGGGGGLSAPPAGNGTSGQGPSGGMGGAGATYTKPNCGNPPDLSCIAYGGSYEVFGGADAGNGLGGRGGAGGSWAVLSGENGAEGHVRLSWEAV